MIKLGEKIRTLRLRDGRTQDALASALGVTAQAVSRWENEVCCPDVELIPSIANYFGVSIDELFGYEIERARRIEALAEKIRSMNRQNNGRDECMDECIALAREALIEFPGNEALSLELACALFNAGYVRHGEHHLVDAEGFGVYDTARHRGYPEWQEAVKLYEKLLPSLPGGENRERAVTELAQLYKNLGEHDKALALAQSAPDLEASRPFLRIKAFDGRAAVAAQGEALLETVRKSVELIVQIVLADGTILPTEAAGMLENAEGLFRLLCPDHCFGRNLGLLSCVEMLRSYYLWLAGEGDEAFQALRVALGYAKELDGLGESAGEFFTSPLLRHVRIHGEKVPAGSALHAELPELWPWWDVPERDRVRTQMQADPRWAEWVARTRA